MDTGFASCMIKYTYATICIVICTIVLFIASADRKASTERFYYYVLFLLVPLIIAMYSLVPLFVPQFNLMSLIYLAGIIAAVVFGGLMFESMQNSIFSSMSKYIVWFVLGLSIIIGLALFYKIFQRSIENVNGWTGFLLQLLFYIPCLIVEIVEYLLGEFKNTPNVVYVLFMLEVMIFLVYIYLPKWVSGKFNRNSNRLLDKPMYLNKRFTLGNDKIFEFMDPSSKKNFNRNYTIDAWIYINPRATNNAGYNKETNIMRYGEPFSKHGKPAIYYTSTGSKTDKYIFYLSDKMINGKIPTYETSLGGQKWNHVAITYLENNVDIFINGNLEKTIPLGLAVPSYYVSDVIEIGYGNETIQKTGLDGAICNVNYYKIPLSSEQISTTYNMYMYKNPPI